MGPGMGNTPDTRALVRTLAGGAAGTVVLDADALNAVSALLAAGEALPRPAGSLILTPHPGEMARLTGLAPAEIAADRPGVAARYAGAWGCTLVLKGHHTIVAAPDGRLWLNTTGNAGLARGGSGDVLAGMTAAWPPAACPRPRPPPARSGSTARPPTAPPCAWASTGCCPTTSWPTSGAIFAENYR